jgi:hypothetical protein
VCRGLPTLPPLPALSALSALSAVPGAPTLSAGFAAGVTVTLPILARAPRDRPGGDGGGPSVLETETLPRGT